MSKLLIVLLGAATLVACSTSTSPEPSSTATVSNCSEAKAVVRSNHDKISQAFANRDATAIGSLELQNRDIVHANMQCFPKMQKQIKYWEKMHKNGDM